MSIRTQNFANVAIIMTDLTRSTAYKLKNGHTKGVERMFSANELTENIFKKYNSHILKNLGDGLLMINDDPIKATKASLELLEEIKQKKYKDLEIELKISITYGSVEVSTKGLSIDVFGSAVDKCARIQSNTKPNQILVEDSIYSICGTRFIDEKIFVSDSEEVKLKNFNKILLREVSYDSTNFIGIINKSYPPFVTELKCDGCGKTITANDIITSMSIVAFYDEYDPVTNINTTKDLWICHKGKCDKSGLVGWRDLSDFAFPEGYIDILYTIINNLNDGSYRMTDDAKNKFFGMMNSLYPYVFRESTKEEFKEFLRNRFLLDMGF